MDKMKKLCYTFESRLADADYIFGKEYQHDEKRRID